MTESAHDLSVSLVVHDLQPDVLHRTLTSLITSAAVARERSLLNQVRMTLIDNGGNGAALPVITGRLDQPDWFHLVIRTEPCNRGFGAGHNPALLGSECRWHLVINPDLFLHPDALCVGLRHLLDHPGTVVVGPIGETESGMPLHLAKNYPSVLALLIRASGSRWLARRFRGVLDRYERLATTSEPPLLSGSCMLGECAALQAVSGFDEQFFLYFEDFDLCMRLRSQGCCAALPEMRAIHLGGSAARKGIRHQRWFTVSMVRFFNRYGWRWL